MRLNFVPEKSGHADDMGEGHHGSIQQQPVGIFAPDMVENGSLIASQKNDADICRCHIGITLSIQSTESTGLLPVASTHNPPS